MSFSYRYENALDLNSMSDRQVLLFALMQLIQRRCLFCRNKKVLLTEQSFSQKVTDLELDYSGLTAESTNKDRQEKQAHKTNTNRQEKDGYLGRDRKEIQLTWNRLPWLCCGEWEEP